MWQSALDYTQRFIFIHFPFRLGGDVCVSARFSLSKLGINKGNGSRAYLYLIALWY